ncbi:MAG TPA: isoprenylcysteine carboxylmethyltransferase family protein [Candidatus Acidoferrales bacterium]|jgi:protein-S-isoprenylcysteine O-methyltransferase Ste14|nr:isoprenylcysteine carboxylmethyltransferase family protein [Candidatus Acidoferrales bacterium]
MMTGTLGRFVAIAAVLIERYVMSLIFFFYAWEHANWLFFPGKSEFTLIQEHPFIEIFRQVVWLLFDIFTGLVLLFGRRVAVLPKNLKDLLIPLSTTFFYLLYEASRYFPVWLTESRCPVALQIPFLTTGLFLNLLGLIIAIWATLSLGRSFGILIEVRKVVTEGAYRWVRHPIYFGYLFFIIGFLATNFSIAFFILVPVQVALMIYRARLEEVRLAESSLEYREYQRHTGFLFPKFRKT